MLCLLLTMVSLLLYHRAASAGFINFDDPQYVINNPHVQQGIRWETIQWAFITFDAGNWHPLTWLSHALDCQLFQLSPAGPHYVNLLFHTANALLLFLLLLSATRRTWLSWAVAALWAIHPLNVESVAWIAERKNVLSMFFFLLALYVYGKFAEKQTIGRYGLVALCFALGLMAKPQVITLPLVLLLWDYWPLQRLEPFGSERPASLLWLSIEKLPLLLLSAGSAFVTLQAQRSGDAVRTLAEFPVLVRIENACSAYLRYVANAFWPSRLSPIYPHPENSIPLWQAIAAAALLLIITGLVVWQRKHRYLPVGWLWFLGTLVPMIGLVQVGQQAMADRYAYLPLIGVLVMVVWGSAEILDRWNISPSFRTAGLAAILIALAIVTYRQLGYWKDSETLWTRALAVTEKNYTAHTNLADTLARHGRADEAIVHFEAAEQLHAYEPSQVLALGIFEEQHGHIDGAARQFKLASQSSELTLRASALAHFGSIQLQKGDRTLASQSFVASLQADPSEVIALVGSGIIAYRDDPEKAATLLGRAVAVQPTDLRLLLLAAALQKTGRTVDAQVARDRAQKNSADLARAQSAANHLLGIQPGISN